MIRRHRQTHRDSRQKRSKKWPGRATAWEVKVAMGLPENGDLDQKRYQGFVNARGDVTVTDKLKGQVVAQVSAEELDRVLVTKGARAGSLLTGEGGSAGYGSVASGISKIKSALNWVGSPADPKRQNEINRSNANTIANSASVLRTSVSKIESIAKSIDGITQGTSDVINGLSRAKTVVKGILGAAGVLGGIFKVLTKR